MKYEYIKAKTDYNALIKQAIEEEARRRYTSDQLKERVAFAQGVRYGYNEGIRLLHLLQQTIKENENGDV